MSVLATQRPMSRPIRSGGLVGHPHWKTLFKLGKWEFVGEIYGDKAYARENNGTELLRYDAESRKWEWYPHIATTSYIFHTFETLTAALCAANISDDDFRRSQTGQQKKAGKT